MSPQFPNTHQPDGSIAPIGGAPEPDRLPDEMAGEPWQASPEDDENNPWRNHEDDQSKWLGLLLAAVGAGAIGYLISVA